MLSNNMDIRQLKILMLRMDEFGNMNGQLLDILFVMRNPPRYPFDKYLKLFEKLNDTEFVNTFFDVERWLFGR
jgi:polyhydroxyalkanoate synthase